MMPRDDLRKEEIGGIGQPQTCNGWLWALDATIYRVIARLRKPKMSCVCLRVTMNSAFL